MQYLVKRNQTYQYRIRIPKDLHKHFQRSEFVRSLKTSRYNIAKQIARQWHHHFNELVYTIRMNALTKEHIHRLVNNFLHVSLNQLEQERLNRNVPSNNLMDELDLYSDYRDGFKQALLDGNYQVVRKEASEVLKLESITADIQSLEYKELCRELIKARIKILNIEEQRAKGNYDNGYDDQNKNTSVIKSPIPTGINKTLKEVIEEYISEVSVTNQWRQDTYNSADVELEALRFWAGNNTDITSIDRKSLVTIRDKLMKLPTNRKKIYPDKNLDELLSMNHARVLSVTTINKYLTRIYAVFEYAFANQYILTNPATNLRLKKNNKASEERDEFNSDDIDALMASPIFTIKLQELLGSSPEKVFVPLIGLYQGMRLNEICQLYIDDIKNVDGIWCFDINDNLDKRIKSRSSKRVIPIHPKIIEYGFLDYVDSITNKHKRVWPDLKYTEGKGYANSTSKWFSRYLKQHITKSSKKGFHSFRHTVANHLKQRGQNLEMVEALLGHENDSISFSRYGKDYEPKVLLDLIKKINYQ